MGKVRKIDYRLERDIMEEIVDSILELQDVMNADFPWKMTMDNLISINNETIQLIIKHIKKGQKHEHK